MKNSNITFKLNEAEKERIVVAAKKRDIPVSQLIREAIKEFLKEEK